MDEKTRQKFNEFSGKEVSDRDLRKAEEKAGNLGDRVKDFKLLLSMFKDGMSGKYKVPTATLALIGTAIIYVVSPLDAIPDVIPVIGWVDDIGVVGFAMSKLSSEISKYKRFRGL